VENWDRDLCQLLLSCLKRGKSDGEAKSLSGLSPERWQAFLKLAAGQRVRPLVWHRIQEKGLANLVPVEVAEAFRKSVLGNTTRNLRLYGELRQLLSMLQSEGLELILLKGIYLASAVYEQIGLREMNDIDVLAHPSDLPRMVEIMTSLGYVPLSPICMDVTFQTQHHLPRMTKNEWAAFELHWCLVYPGLSYSLDIEDLWKHAVFVQAAGFNARALSPEDLLLHLSVHVSYHHQFNFSLRPFCDIAEIIHRFNSAIDWHAFVEQAIAKKLQRGVYLTLRLAKEMVEADVPAFVLEELQPPDGAGILIETAYSHIFSCQSVPEHLAELLESGSFWTKLRIFLQRVFLPKATIAALYSLPADSAKIYIYYPRRFFDVLRRHQSTLRKFHQEDASTKALAERVNNIAKWLDS
jgi:hypothetical protein